MQLFPASHRKRQASRLRSPDKIGIETRGTFAATPEESRVKL
jgi:hypothetical protein